MRITKFGHACVRLETNGRTIVLDPGNFTEAEAVEGADAILITHEHADHFDIDNLRRTDAPIFTISAVAAQIEAVDRAAHERVTVVGPGETFDVAGVSVEAVGELHAIIHREVPTYYNSGYVVRGEQTVYHPGDSFTLPGQPVDVLLAPISAPWLKIGEGVDFARAVRAPRVLGIHDGLYNEVGLNMIGQRMSAMLESYSSAYQWVPSGSDLV